MKQAGLFIFIGLVLIYAAVNEVRKYQKEQQIFTKSNNKAGKFFNYVSIFYIIFFTILALASIRLAIKYALS